FDYTRAGWENLVGRVFDQLVPKPALTAFFPELYERFAEPDAWRVFDDVRPTLKTLAAMGCRLGIISNWDERLRVLLERLDLNRYFDAAVISCEIGFPKPSPIIFEQAAARLRLSSTAILHVGDDFERDVQGARAAGFQACWLRRDDQPRSDQTEI